MKWWQTRKRNEDLERELRSDLELEEEEQRDRGLSADEARYAARRAFGNTTLIREQLTSPGDGSIERFLQDLRYALRQFREISGVCVNRDSGVGSRNRRERGDLRVRRCGSARAAAVCDPNRLMSVNESSIESPRWASFLSRFPRLAAAKQVLQLA